MAASRGVSRPRGGADEFLDGDNVVRINLGAPILLSGPMRPLIAGRHPTVIVNRCSGLGFVPAARMPVYSATKAGLHAFRMALRRQLAPAGIQPFGVVPPAVRTRFNPGAARTRGCRATSGPRSSSRRR